MARPPQPCLLSRVRTPALPTLLLLAAAALCPRPAAAWGFLCAGVNPYEILFSVDTTDASVFDIAVRQNGLVVASATGVHSGTNAGVPTTNDGHCDWRVEVNTNPGVNQVRANTLAQIEFVRIGYLLDGVVIPEPPVSYLYSYYTCLLGDPQNMPDPAERFYCPSYHDQAVRLASGQPPPGLNQDTFFKYAEGDMHAAVVPYHNLPGVNGVGFEGVYGGDEWVYPYNHRELCAAVGATAEQCQFYTQEQDLFLSPQVGPTYRFAPQYDVVVPTWARWDWALPQGRLLFGASRKLVVRGTLDATGVTLTAADMAQRWGGVAVAQGHFRLTGGTVDWATTGVAVYEPARATLTDATIAQNTTGLDVRSRGSGGAPGALVQGVTLSGNGTGVRSDFYAGYGGGTACLTDCRSRFTLRDSPATFRRTAVTASTGAGVYALNTTADIRLTDLTANEGGGLRVANALVELTRENTVTGNGAGGGYGASVLTAGNFRLSPTNARARNRVANNRAAEVWVFDGGLAFFGSTFQTGFNAVYDAGGGRLVRYPAGPVLPAKYQWWGSASGPNPPTAFAGPVEYCPHLTCDPTENPSCDDYGCDTSLRPRRPPRGGASAARVLGMMTPLRGDIVIGDTTGEGSFLDSLAADIGALQAALVADGDGPGADTLVASLAALHRLDLADQTGAWAGTALLFAALRATLAVPDLDADAQAAGEAALVGEAILALEREEYIDAAGLVAGDGALAEGAEAVRQLALVEAFLLALEGRRGEASALVAGLAAEAEDPEEAQELAALAAALGEEEGGPAFGPGGGLVASASEGAAASEAVGLRLTVLPNPSAGSATVTLTLDGPTRVRLTVYDALGREVARLHDGSLGAGAHALRLGGAGLRPGAYVVRAVVEPTEGAARTLARPFTVLR